MFSIQSATQVPLKDFSCVRILCEVFRGLLWLVACKLIFDLMEDATAAAWWEIVTCGTVPSSPPENWQLLEVPPVNYPSSGTAEMANLKRRLLKVQVKGQLLCEPGTLKVGGQTGHERGKVITQAHYFQLKWSKIVVKCYTYYDNSHSFSALIHINYVFVVYLSGFIAIQ